MWEHQGIVGLPIIDIISERSTESTKDVISFKAEPYLEIKQNGNNQPSKEHLVCTGGRKEDNDNSKGRLAKYQVTDSLSFHPYHLKHGNYIATLKEHKDIPGYLVKLKANTASRLILGNYRNRTDTIYSYNEALVKSVFSAYLYQASNRNTNEIGQEGFKKIYSYIVVDPSRSDASVNYYVNATMDKLAFLEFFLDSPRQRIINSNSEVPYVQGKHAYAYPNPATNHVTIQFESTRPDMYTIEIFDNSGSKRATIFKDVELAEGTHTKQVPIQALQAGLYYIMIIRNSSNSVETIKILKK